MKPKILLADDHRMVAEGVRGLLEPEYHLVGIVEDGRALLEAVEKLRPDVVVADVSMPLLVLPTFPWVGDRLWSAPEGDHEGHGPVFSDSGTD